MLGVPSLASLPEVTDRRGLYPSSVRRGLNGPLTWFARRCPSPKGNVAGFPELIELADDSVVIGCLGAACGFTIRRRRSVGSSRSVALRSWPDVGRRAGSGEGDRGTKAGDSSSSSSSFLSPGRCIENLPNRRNRGPRPLAIVSSSSDSDSEELDVRSSSSRVGDLCTRTLGA